MSQILEILSIVTLLSLFCVQCQYIAEQSPKALYTTHGLGVGNLIEEKSQQYVPPQGYPVAMAMQNQYSSDYYSTPAPAEAPAPQYNSYTYSAPTEATQPMYYAQEEGNQTQSYVQEEESEGEGGDDGGDKDKDADKDTKQDAAPEDNPLNFLNLLGTDFQPGRLVNIFFGLFILLFMLVAQGYAMWVFGIAFLPGTRSLNEWKLDVASLDTLLVTVIDAFEYWEDKQQQQKKIK